jgi:hypothetical protein
MAKRNAARNRRIADARSLDHAYADAERDLTSAAAFDLHRDAFKDAFIRHSRRRLGLPGAAPKEPDHVADVRQPQGDGEGEERQRQSQD